MSSFQSPSGFNHETSLKRKHYDAEAQFMADEMDIWKRPRSEEDLPYKLQTEISATGMDIEGTQDMPDQHEPGSSFKTPSSTEGKPQAEESQPQNAQQGIYHYWKRQTGENGQNNYGIRLDAAKTNNSDCFYREWRKSSQTVVQTREFQREAKRDMVRLWNHDSNQTATP